MLNKAIQLMLCIVINTVFHEFGHYLSIKLYGQKARISFGVGKLVARIYDFEFRANPFASYVQSFDDIKNPTLFYASGSIANFVLFITVFLLLPQFDWFWKYSLFVFLCNLIIVFPGGDMYKCVNLGKYIDLNDNAESSWKIAGILLSLLAFVGYIVYFFVFY